MASRKGIRLKPDIYSFIDDWINYDMRHLQFWGFEVVPPTVTDLSDCGGWVRGDVKFDIYWDIRDEYFSLSASFTGRRGKGAFTPLSSLVHGVGGRGHLVQNLTESLSDQAALKRWGDLQRFRFDYISGILDSNEKLKDVIEAYKDEPMPEFFRTGNYWYGPR